MQKSADSRVLVACTSKWAAFVALLKVLAEYTGDYLSGDKYKYVARLNQEKQNTK